VPAKEMECSEVEERAANRAEKEPGMEIEAIRPGKGWKQERREEKENVEEEKRERVPEPAIRRAIRRRKRC